MIVDTLTWKQFNVNVIFKIIKNIPKSVTHFKNEIIRIKSNALK